MDEESDKENKDQRLEDLKRHIFGEERSEIVPRKGETFKGDLINNSTPNKYALFDPDPSYVPNLNMDHPLLKPEKPFGELPIPPQPTEEEHKKFLKEQNERVNLFWKFKKNN